MKRKISENRKNFYSTWMRERSIDLELNKVDETEIVSEILKELNWDEESPSPLARCEVRNFDNDVQPGDIRLLNPEQTTDNSFSYVCVLSIYDGFAVVAPFSKYSTPATNAEWATGSEAMALKVLQLWNAQPFPVSEIERTWKCMSMPKEMLDRAKEIYKCSIIGTMPEEREDIGLQILSEDDIRNDYLAEDFEKYSPLHLAREKLLQYRECMAMIKDAIVRKVDFIRSLRGWTQETEPMAYSEIFKSSVVLAAASLDGNKNTEFVADGLGCELHFEFSSDDNVYKVNVCEANSSDFTNKLDGFKLVDYFGREICVIADDGFCEVPFERFEGDFCLVDIDGNPVEITKKDDK